VLKEDRFIMKVLLTSVGRRGYLVKYFKQDLDSEGEVWGADSSQYTPAFKYCDKTAILPEVSESDYRYSYSIN
jgi:carbamoyl-phosphate synthase large subunit